MPFLAFTPEQVEQLRGSLWHEIDLRIRDLMALVGTIRNESVRYDSDQRHLLDLLREGACQAGEIGDNLGNDLIEEITNQADVDHLATGGGEA